MCRRRLRCHAVIYSKKSMDRKRINRIGKYVLVTVLLTATPASGWAQRMIKVSGTVYNIADKKKKVPFSGSVVYVYSCKTVAAAEDLKNNLDKDNTNLALFMDKEERTETDANGYYEILVPDNGALIFKAGLNKAVLEKVNNRMKIDVEVDDGIYLKEVVVTGQLKQIQPEPKASRLIGNRFYPYNTFVIPAGEGNKYSRLIVQPYVLNCETNDTVAFLEPLVYDGKEYHLTQTRRMGYNLKRDALEPYIQQRPLVNNRMVIEWQDTITVPDPNVNYSCYADFSIEDYRSIPFRKTYQINTCENKRPLKFLEYDLIAQDMDFQKYPEKAQVEKFDTEDQVELSFEISSDQLTDDPKNQESLAGIRKKLDQILNEPGAMLKEFHVIGKASPEGDYYMNLRLAEKRMKRIQQEVIGALPRAVADRVYQNPQAEVASWNEVADLMEKDSLTEVAGFIRNVIKEFPDQMNRQGQQIKARKDYRTVIVPYLEQLRQVKYLCRYDIYREPTDQEVMEAFRKEGLKGMYTRYEYWKLLQLLKDNKEKEAVARKAYEESLSMKNPWVLAGNTLARLYLERGATDTRILEPLIDRTIFTVNYERRNIDTGRTDIINPIEVVANQLCMYIKANDFENASVMAKLIPDEYKEFALVKAYAWAMGGYFQGGSTPEEAQRAQQTFQTICRSSIQNEAVMNLALETPQGDTQAEKALEQMSDNKPVKWYLKAVIAARKGDAGLTEAALYLVRCFNLDKKMIVTAQNDGEFNKEIVETALDMYKNQ